VDPKVRFEHQGISVPANAPLVFKHKLTGQWLASDEVSYKNDFGNECEVSCHSFLIPKKTQQLGSERSGKLTVDVPARHQSDQNVWMLVTAADPSQELETLPQDADLTVGQVLVQVKSKLQERGPFGVRAMMKGLRNLDELNAKKLGLDDFKWGLINYGVVLDEESFYKLVRRYDPKAEGAINFEDFFVELKGQISERRVRLVSLAYQKLDKNGDGQVRLDFIAQEYDAASNPYVRTGRITEDQAFREFMSMWDTTSVEGVVSLQEFAKFYEDMSAGVARDEEFEGLVRSAWHV
jgi:Ca2+-binding EF-hand superfamily protein